MRAGAGGRAPRASIGTAVGVAMSVLPGSCRGASATTARRLLLLLGPHARVGGRRLSVGKASREGPGRAGPGRRGQESGCAAEGSAGGRVEKRAARCAAGGLPAV